MIYRRTRTVEKDRKERKERRLEGIERLGKGSKNREKGWREKERLGGMEGRREA